MVTQAKRSYCHRAHPSQNRSARCGELWRYKINRRRISELRINYGPGYRIYYLQEGRQLIILLCGGDKSSQASDIRQARHIAKEWKEHGK